jgi:hypothetical protein
MVSLAEFDVGSCVVLDGGWRSGWFDFFAFLMEELKG